MYTTTNSRQHMYIYMYDVHVEWIFPFSFYILFTCYNPMENKGNSNGVVVLQKQGISRSCPFLLVGQVPHTRAYNYNNYRPYRSKLKRINKSVLAYLKVIKSIYTYLSR